ncbi:unnamed protein product [Pedinophyceae sp. YPF-701]|nr:unnamed protein product [Pedinophyceae sp. YPF-701]
MRSMGEQHSAHEARGGVGVGDAAGAAGNGDGEASAAMENAPDEGRDQNDVEQDDPGDQNDVEQDDPGDQNDVELSPGRRGAASGAGTQDEAGDNISLLPSARSGQGGGRGDAAGDGGAQGGPPHAAERAAGTAGAKVDRPARPMQSCNNDAFAHPAGATAAAVPAPPAPAVAQGSAPPRWPTPPGVSAPIDESPVPQAAVFIKGAPSHPGSSKGAAGTDAPGRHQGGHAGVAIGHGSGNGGQRVAPNSAGGDLAALLALDRAGSGNGNGGARVDGTPHVDNAVVVENAAGHDRPSPNEAAMSCQGSMGAAPATPVPDIPPRPQAAMYIKGGSQLEDPHPALSSPPPARRGRPLAAGAARQGVGRRSSGGNDEIAGEVVEVAGSTRRAAFTPGKALWAGGSGGDAPPDAVGSMADFAAEAVGEDEPVVDGNDGWSPEADLAGGDGAGRARGGVTRGTRQASRMGAIVLGSPGASCGGQHAADKRASSTMWSDGGPVGGSGRQSRAARATGGRDAAEPSPVAEAAGSGPDRGQQAAVVAMDHSAGVPHHHHAHVHRRTHGVADESPVNAVIVGARTVEGDDVVGGEDPRGVHHGSNGGRGDGPKQARARTTSGSRGDAGPSKRQRVGSPAPPVAAPAAASHGPSHVPDPQAHPAWARASAHGGSTTSMGPARAALEAGAQPQTNHLPGASQGAAAESGGSKRGADGEGMQSGGEDMAGAIENGGGVGGGAGHAATAAALMRRSVGGVGGSRDIGKAVMRVPGVGGGVGGVGGGAAAPESSKDDSREARAVRDDDAVEVGGGGDGRVGEGGDDVAVDEDAAGGSDGEPRERARGRSASLNSHLVAASNSGTRGGRIVVHPGLLIKSHAAPAAVADLARDGDAGGRGDGNGRRRSDAPQNAVVAGGTPADVGAQPFDGASRHGDAVRPPMTTPGDGRGLQPLTMAGMLAHAAERHATGLANLLHSSPGQQVRVEAWEQRPARAGEAAGPLIIDWSRGNNGSRRVAVAPRPGADSRMGDIRGDQDDEPPPYAAPSTGAGRAGSTTACLDGADPVGGAARAARVAGPVHDEGTPHGGARGDADGDGDGEGRDGGDMGRAIHPQCAEVADGLGVGRMTDVAEGGDGPRQPTASALGRMVGARTGTGGAGDAVAARRASGPVPRPPASTDAVVAGDAPLDGAVGPAAANGDADRAGEPDNERLRWESNHAVAHGGFPPAMHSFWATLGGPLVAAAIQQGVHVPGIVPPPPPWRPGNSQAGATGAGAHGMHGAAPARQQPAATTSRASAATGSAMQGGIGQNCPEPAPTGISGGILGGAPHIVRNALQGASASGQGLSGTAAGRSRSGYYQQPGGNTPAGVSGGLEALNTLFAQRAGAGPAASGANHSGAASGGGLLLAYSLAEAVSYQLHSGGEQNQVGVLGELARQVSSHLAASRGRTPARSNLRASGEGPVSPPLPKPSGSSAAGVGVPVPVDAGSAGDDDNGGENGSGDPSPSPRIPAGAWAGSWLPASVAGAAASAERPARSGGAAGALSCRSESMQGQSSSGLPDERGSKRRRLLSSTQE